MGRGWNWSRIVFVFRVWYYTGVEPSDSATSGLFIAMRTDNKNNQNPLTDRGLNTRSWTDLFKETRTPDMS